MGMKKGRRERAKVVVDLPYLPGMVSVLNFCSCVDLYREMKRREFDFWFTVRGGWVLTTPPKPIYIFGLCFLLTVRTGLIRQNEIKPFCLKICRDGRRKDAFPFCCIAELRVTSHFKGIHGHPRSQN